MKSRTSKNALSVSATDDEVPYGSRAIPATHPDRLALEALLHGLHPAPPERCRLLELGCAEAANLAAMAFHLDESHFVGVDASQEEMEIARETRDRLALDNLDLRLENIIDLDDDLGTFDYIVAHGVLSWVPPRVQERIFEICRNHLAPQGVAYLSYNCSPGWAIKSQLRHAIARRVRGVTDPTEKIRRLRELLVLMAKSPLNETTYGILLAEQATAAFHQRDEYLLHEYLSPENRAFQFHEIVDEAESHGLAFLAELNQATSNKGVEDTIREGLSKTLDDPIEAEELADVMLFRSFRISLFCHRDALPSVSDPVETARAAAERCTFAGLIRSESKRFSLDPDVNEVFITADNTQISANHPLLKTALLEIGKSWPRGLGLSELCQRSELLLEMRRVFEPGQKITDIEMRALGQDLLHLSQMRHLELRVREPESAAHSAGSLPKVNALTRLEASRGPFVTTPYHQVISLDPFTRHLVQHLDGSRNIEALTARMLAHFERGDVTAQDEEGTPLEKDALKEALPALVQNALDGLTSNVLDD